MDLKKTNAWTNAAIEPTNATSQIMKMTSISFPLCVCQTLMSAEGASWGVCLIGRSVGCCKRRAKARSKYRG